LKEAKNQTMIHWCFCPHCRRNAGRRRNRSTNPDSLTSRSES